MYVKMYYFNVLSFVLF